MIMLGDPRMYSAEAAFWRSVRIVEGDECWTWMGTKGGAGKGKMYGVFSYIGRYGKVGRTAHRFSFELHWERDINGLHIGQLCGNRLCVRPTHLYVKEDVRSTRRTSIFKGRAFYIYVQIYYYLFSGFLCTYM